MLKNKLLPLLFVVACSPQAPQKLVSERWLEGRNEFVTLRLPASGANPSCRNELFTVDEVKREALHYETQLNTGSKVSGKWKHLDLKTLPIPQAKFLKDIGDNLGDLNNPNAISYADCRDAVCVVNKVYSSTDGLEGWMTYLWYLKMGYHLSFKNKIYSQNSASAGTYNGKVFPLADYLFSRDEFYGFWRMSHALTTPFRNLPKMNEIQRIPRKSAIEDSGPMTCGLAWSTGYVLVNDGCLSFWGDKDNGFIYEGVTHELGHQIDYKLADDTPGAGNYYSQIGKWKEIGGWSLKEYWDETRKVTVQEWVTTLRNDQFVRDYARNSPAEHFADTIAYYRYSGDTTKRKIPKDVYEHLQEKVFDGLEYDSPGLFKQFEKDINTLLAPDIFKMVVECEQNPRASSTTKPLAESLFPFTVDIQSRRCLRENLNLMLDQSVVEAKLNHVNGCAALKAPDKVTSFRTQMENVFTKQIVEHIKVARENQEYYKKLNEFYKSLSQRVEPLKIMTSCYRQADEKACYDEKILALVQELIPQDLVNAENLTIDLQKMYLDANKFEIVRADNMKLHQDFLITQANLIDESAANLWEVCLNKGIDNSEEPIPGPFSVGESWMVSSQFNCLSMDIPEEVRRVVSDMSFEARGITDGRESLLLFDLTLPTFTKEISRLYEADRQIEANKVSQLIKDNRSKLTARLKSDFAWITQLGMMGKLCEAEAKREFPQDLRYHEYQQTFSATVESICTDVARSKEYQDWLKSQRVRGEADITDNYLVQLTEQAEIRADVCLRKYPNSNFATRLLNKRKRNECYESNWYQVEDAAWSKVADKYKNIFDLNRTQLVSPLSTKASEIKVEVQKRRLGGAARASEDNTPQSEEEGSTTKPRGEQVKEDLEQAARDVGSFFSRLGKRIGQGVEDIVDDLNL